MLDHKTVLTAAQCFFGDEDCCTPKNSIDENCEAELFTDDDTIATRHHARVCDGKDFATAADVFVTAGGTSLYKDIVDAAKCSSCITRCPTCEQDPNIQVNVVV